jgi:hypothetical protein
MSDAEGISTEREDRVAASPFDCEACLAPAEAFAAVGVVATLLG